MPIKKWSSLPIRVVDKTKQILQLLKKHEQRAVFFVLGWIAGQYPDLIKSIANEGHQIGYHSYYHQLPESQSKQEFESDLVQGLSLLEKIVGEKIIYYRTPLFSLNMNSLWIMPILLKHGIKVSSSTKSGVRLLGSVIPSKPFCFEFNNQKIVELPLNRASLFGQNFVCSGSGYIRVLPWNIVNYFYQKKDYTLTYFHPRDFDLSIPIAKELGVVRNLLNRLGNKSTVPKFNKLLNNFDFLPPDQIQTTICNQCKNHEVPVILLDDHLCEK